MQDDTRRADQRNDHLWGKALIWRCPVAFCTEAVGKYLGLQVPWRMEDRMISVAVSRAPDEGTFLNTARWIAGVLRP